MPRATAEAAHASLLHKRLTKTQPTFNKIKYVTHYTLSSHGFLECIKDFIY